VYPGYLEEDNSPAGAMGEINLGFIKTSYLMTDKPDENKN
jgi:hypothetical protein